MAPHTAGSQPSAAMAIAISDMPIPRDHALKGDSPAATGDRAGLAQPVDPVDGQDHIGSLRCRGGAMGAQGHADVGDGQGRSVVYPVTDHDGRGSVVF